MNTARKNHTLDRRHLLLTLSALGLAGCVRTRRTSGPPLSANQPDPQNVAGDIQVWSWNIAAKSLQKLVPDFEKRYPKVRAHVDMTGTNMQARFLLSLSSGVGAPDVMQLQQTEASRYIATERLADLTPVAAKYKDHFPASVWASCTYKGKIYAIPWDIGPCAVYYKRGMFQQYNIDPDQIATWDDFIAAGKVIKEKSGGKTRMLPLSSGQMMWLFEILLQQAGAQIFDNQGRIAINSPQSAEVLALLKRMLDSGICLNVPMWGQEFMAALKDDSVATYPLAVWFGGTIKDTVQEYAGQKQEWGVFPLPALRPGGLRVSNLGGSVLVIPDQCIQKEAAWSFVDYALCTVEGQIAQYKNFDLFPAYLPALSDPYMDSPDPFFGGQKVSRLFATGVDRIPPLNRTRDWVEANGYVEQALSAWATGGDDTGDLFARLEKKLARRLGREVVPHA